MQGAPWKLAGHSCPPGVASLRPPCPAAEPRCLRWGRAEALRRIRLRRVGSLCRGMAVVAWSCRLSRHSCPPPQMKPSGAGSPGRCLQVDS